MVKRTIRLLSGDQYFQDKLPIYVNRNSESYELTEHYHDFFELSYVSEGTGTHHTGEQFIEVQAGDLFLIPIGMSHVFRPSSSKKHPLIVYNCIVQLDQLAPLLTIFPGGESLSRLLSLKDIFHAKDQAGEAHGLFTSLYLEYSTKRPEQEAALYALLIQLLVLYARKLDGVHEDNEIQRATYRMDEIISLLKNNLSESYSLSELALMYGVSERQFQRLFSKHTGMTLSSFVQACRIAAACELLRTSNHKIASIAEAVGYAHIPSFYEVFKKHMGVSPRDYRRNVSGVL